jgi:hypothetical protein
LIEGVSGIMMISTGIILTVIRLAEPFFLNTFISVIKSLLSSSETVIDYP